MKDFKKGQKIKLVGGGEAEVLQKLGEGGQGIVYKVSYGGKEYALKWYFYNKLLKPDKFYDNIKNNILKGAPTDSFLWPHMLTEKQFGSFGYVMYLRPSDYHDFSLLLLNKVKYKSVLSVVNTALNITNSFRDLHREGYNYQDLNDGNFFFNPDNGDVLICDNDNVVEQGRYSGIAGKCRYMAPEIVMGKSKPNRHTDSFSLAVVLFLLLLRSHPLEGKGTASHPCMTEKLEKSLYGKDAKFIFDPNDDSNSPVRGLHDNAMLLWPFYPQFIRDAFIKTFTSGMHNPQERISETEWQKLFIRLRDLFLLCGKCGGESFGDQDGQNNTICPYCGTKIDKPLFLHVKKNVVALYPGNNLYECHTVSDSDQYKKITGEILRNKKNPNLWGLKNLSGYPWFVTMPDGSEKTVEDGQITAIYKQIKIDFGNNVGEIL